VLERRRNRDRNIADLPILSRRLDAATGGAVPVVTGSLSLQWAHCRIISKDELAPAHRIDVYTPDYSFRGSFTGFLNFLAGNGVNRIDGSAIVDGRLQHAFERWAP
jgi:hypothetical protein